MCVCVYMCPCNPAPTYLRGYSRTELRLQHGYIPAHHLPDPLCLLPAVDQVLCQARWGQGGAFGDTPWGLTSKKHQGRCLCVPGKAGRPSAGLFQLLEGQKALNEHLLCPGYGGETHAENAASSPQHRGCQRRDPVCSMRAGKDGPREGLDVSGGAEAAGLGLAHGWTNHCSSPGPQDSSRRLSETLHLWEGDRGPENGEVGDTHPAWGVEGTTVGSWRRGPPGRMEHLHKL